MYRQGFCRLRALPNFAKIFYKKKLGTQFLILVPSYLAIYGGAYGQF